jgi:hypothetical protein
VLPNWDEGDRVPLFSVGVPDRGLRITRPAMIRAREKFVHVFNNLIVCRRSSDFRVEWSAQPGADHEARSLAISAKGDVVVGGMYETGKISGRQRRNFLAILDGSTGVTVSRIPTEATAALAVSDDGKLVAAGSTIDDQPVKGMIEARVRLYSLLSGKHIGYCLHAVTPVERRLAAGFDPQGIHFTPDGKYLITGGLDTRVWGLDGITP